MDLLQVIWCFKVLSDKRWRPRLLLEERQWQVSEVITAAHCRPRLQRGLPRQRRVEDIPGGPRGWRGRWPCDSNESTNRYPTAPSSTRYSLFFFFLVPSSWGQHFKLFRIINRNTAACLPLGSRCFKREYKENVRSILAILLNKLDD